MASRSWDDRPLPPLPPEAYEDSRAASTSLQIPQPLPFRKAHRANTSVTILPVHEDNAVHRAPNDDSSFDDDDVSIRPTTGRPVHSRSMSNPFPSFFSGGKKKKDKKKAGPPSPLPIGASDHGASTRQTMHMQSPLQPAANDTRRKPVQGPHDFRTGHCMTCASLVRWPKDLHVFRCTICLTINDTEPPVPLQSPRNGSQQRDGLPYLKVDAISLSHTKSLVEKCVRSSLKTFKTSYESSNRDASGTCSIPITSRHRRPSPGYATRVDSLTATRPIPSSHRRTATLDISRGDDTGSHARLPTARQSTQQPYSTSYPGERLPTSPRTRSDYPSDGSVEEFDKDVFKQLEEYLVQCFKSYHCLNNSFLAAPNARTPRSEHVQTPTHKPQHIQTQSLSAPDLLELDPKLLMLGNFAENGFWWTGGEDARQSSSTESSRKSHTRTKSNVNRLESLSSITASPCIDWFAVMDWYNTIINAPDGWRDIYEELVASQADYQLSKSAEDDFERLLWAAHHRLQRVFLKCIETLLKRPGTLITEPQTARFLLILVCNPLLTASAANSWDRRSGAAKSVQGKTSAPAVESSQSGPGRHSGIIKRILGLLANSSEDCHRHMILWLSIMPDYLFLQSKDLAASFISYRLNRQNEKVIEARVNVIDSLVPQMAEQSGRSTTASLHATLLAPNSQKKQKQVPEPKRSAYTDDWQVKAAARVMALIYAANESARHAGSNRGVSRPLPTSDFYHSLVDTLDFKNDFELWESKRAKFTFCQYPFLLSIWAKIQILEHDAKRQMTGKAREAFFDSILSHRTYAQHLVLKIRRDCLVDDSLKKVSEVVGSGSEDIKKALRIEFDGEEGVDAGGLRKEWFLLLVREVFNPDHGLFVYDDDSQLCYFNPHSFETSDQYFLVGVVLGLAIYNSTILDIALPAFAFRKLLAAGPAPGNGAHPKPTMNYTLDDLAEFRPAVARGLRQLLDYKGDVQSDLCLDFVAEVERYGTRTRVPLCPGGETKMVTSANRREYVDLYVRYHLDTSVTRQFEPFKRGFFTVCGGNALSLFRPEEIELLVRGSDEALDITSLRGAAEYSHWGKGSSPDAEATVQWFWQTFQRASPTDQRRLLAFITGSDRIPATGAAALIIRINCLGDDEGRFPSARTCFNMLSLYRCKTKQRLEESLWRAVHESEGFGLK